MAHSTKKTDVYYLLIYFPETYKNQPEYQNMIERMQSLINDLDFNKVNSLLDQFSSMFEQENDETMTMINELKEFKNIVNK